MLSINMPETSDADFSWQEFVRRNNDELVATYGNLVHRVLTITYRNFDGFVPPAGEIDAESKALLTRSEATLDNVDSLLYNCRFREAMRESMLLAQEANRYIDAKAPWKIIKADRKSAATALSTVLGVISCLKTVLYPFLPFSSQKLHHMLGFDGTIEAGGWAIRAPQAGQKLASPEPLFAKLDDTIAEEEDNRMEQSVVTSL
jgi:methionyl-tRNA synthetase